MNRHPKEHLGRYLFVLVIVFLAIAFPFNLVVAPERELKIIDSKGNPIGNAEVRQIWYKYPHETREIGLHSNSKGHVYLQELAVRTNIAWLISGAVIQLYDHGFSASFRSRERVVISVPGHPPRWFYDGKGLESGTVVFQVRTKE